MVNLVRISKALEDGKEKAGITIEALLVEYEEQTTKNNAPYIKGLLRDKKETLTFKHWGCNMMEFRKKYKLKEGQTYVVQICGDIEIWEGQMQMNAKNIVINENRDANNYINAAIYPAESMLSSITNLVDKFITSPIFNKICHYILESPLSEGLSYYPYNCEVHSEKSGFLYHLYNCITKALKLSGDPKKVIYNGDEPSYKSVVDFQVVITAILCYKLSILDRYVVDKTTGLILEKDVVRDTLYGDIGNIMRCTLIITSSYNSLIEEGVTPENMGNYYRDDTMNLLHCVTVLNSSDITPATLEAQVVKDIVNSEINEFLMQTKIDSLGEGEVLRGKFKGENRTFICLKKV